MVGKIDESKEKEFCECCTRQINKTQFDIGCDLKELAFLGAGYVLYFEFIKFCLKFLAAVLLVSAGYNMYTNYAYGTKCIDKSLITDKD